MKLNKLAVLFARLFIVVLFALPAVKFTNWNLSTFVSVCNTFFTK